jgi:hypothetical protein
MMSFTAFAYNRSLQSSQSHTVKSLANMSAGGGGPSGTAHLQWNAQTKELTTTVRLSGLQPESSYANHIHLGDCSIEGEVLYSLNNVVTDAAGNGTATTTINNVTGGIPASGWDITVHTGPTAEASRLLCGNVVNPEDATEVTVLLRAVDPMN